MKCIPANGPSIQKPNLGAPEEHFLTVGRGLQIPCQVMTGRVEGLVTPSLPKETPGHVVDLPPVGDIGRHPAETVIFSQGLQRKAAHDRARVGSPLHGVKGPRPGGP